MKITRRSFIRNSLGLAGASLIGLPAYSLAASAKVIIIGGGAAGCIAARYLKKLNPALDVTLIEKNVNYTSAFFNNQVLVGQRKLASLEFNYKEITASGINLINSSVTEIDAPGKKIKLSDGKVLPYERLIISTGVSANVSNIKGANSASLEENAWAPAVSIADWSKRLQSLKQGGNVLVSIPAGEFSGQFAAYERASQIAHYSKKNNPKAKILVIDGNPKSEQQTLFTEAWSGLYGNMIEIQYGLAVTEVSATGLHAGGNVLKGDLVNFIPPQQASDLLLKSGLTDDTGWCPVKADTFESSKQANIHVIGDAMKSAGSFRKNAQAANGQAKVAAIVINGLINGKTTSDLPPVIDSEYAILAADYAISSSRIYRLQAGKWTLVSQGNSSANAPEKQHKREVLYAQSWFNNITHEMFGRYL